ncbi:DUF6328 family protein (plasmid) [Ensifer adhaerens]|nr:DUF6328 family protein [Ensifer adhaerens]UAY05641.1 DUF6328 family protein [Ensifer adhaerens]UAY13019.1 DUF6328 family protein [Ensifer adhaerens]
MLMLGAQILLGFQLQAPFQDAFSDLSVFEKWIEAIVLCIMVLIIALLITPSARHRIVERGEATQRFIAFVTRISFLTLAPFSLALGLDLSIAIGRALGWLIGGVAGAFSGAVALGLWYGPTLISDNYRDTRMATSNEKTPTAARSTTS